MSTPIIRRLTVEEAKQELRNLEQQVEGGIDAFEERAHSYDLSPTEQGVWQRISELRWLLGKH
ncbi:hypothetical protein [Corynebacterium riegelii]